MCIRDSTISAPTNFRRHHNVTRDPTTSTGFRGLPPEWREALRELWAEQPSEEAHYVTAFAEDFAPSMAEALMAWLPDGCVRDDRFEAARDWDSSVADYSTLGDCRDLNSVFWFGAAGVGVSTHYDISHNLFFQVAGRKRFTLLMPSAHRALRLFPFWHGSNRQAQAALPADTKLREQMKDNTSMKEVLSIVASCFGDGKNAAQCVARASSRRCGRGGHDPHARGSTLSRQVSVRPGVLHPALRPSRRHAPIVRRQPGAARQPAGRPLP